MSLNHWSFSERPPLTLLELKMMQFSGAIREKDLWWEKINEDDIRRKWKKEAKQQGGDQKNNL